MRGEAVGPAGREGALSAPWAAGLKEPRTQWAHQNRRVLDKCDRPRRAGTGDEMGGFGKHLRFTYVTVTAALFLALTISGATAGSNLFYKAALHVVPHEERTCEAAWPEITDCAQVNTTYEGCYDFDVFPVFFDLVEVGRLEYGMSWPAGWGDCLFTACAGDRTLGGIVSPGDGIAHEWDECHQAEIVVPGYAWFSSTVTPGQIVLVANPSTGFFGATDCDGARDFAIGVAASGVCGIPGEDPCTCGCGVEASTWSEIKTMFR
jgi:hypothetical protein